MAASDFDLQGPADKKMSQNTITVTKLDKTTIWRFPLKCENCPELITEPPYVDKMPAGTRHYSRYYHLACYPTDLQPREGWVNAIQKARRKRSETSVSEIARAAGVWDNTIKKESLKIAATLDYEDFRKFALSVPWALKG